MRRKHVGAAALATLGLIGSAVAAGAQEAPGAAGLTPAATQPELVGQIDVSEAKLARAVRSPNGDLNVIVKLADDSLADYDGGVPGLAPTNIEVTGEEQLDVTAAGSQQYLRYLNGRIDAFAGRAARVGATVRKRFDVVLGGVALQVPAASLAALEADPAVLAVLPDTLEQPTTDASADFIGAPTVWNQLGGQESAGEGVIVGVLDSGIWPEHPSMSDPDPSGKPYAAPPAPPSGTRACDFSAGANPGPAFTCNNKLIGAERFMSTYEAVVGVDPGGYTSARDDNGHGSHTATTAAGNAGVAASIYGVARGTVTGIAPRAHVIAYKVCGEQGCFSSDSVSAVQAAIEDGVDVINFSISGGANPYTDAVSLAFLDAYNAGIFVAASAGNDGPDPDTVNHREPWVTTVAASTSDRSFIGSTTVASSDGATLTVPGVTITAPLTTPTPLLLASSVGDDLCQSQNAAFAGKVVVCTRGAIGRAQKGFNVAQAGGVGMILANAVPQDVETDNHWLPAIHLTSDQAAPLLAFVAAHPDVTATIASGVASPDAGDVMAAFSSRGGDGQVLGISKPDVTAPGVQILAGHTPTPLDVAGGPPGELFQAIAGTSMSSPHVAGAGALLAALHPSWTPGQIRSALMTTADTTVVDEDGTASDAFDYGSGRIDLTDAGSPGFTIDASGADFLTHRDALYKANYPSLYIPALAGALTVERTLTSVESRSRTYTTKVSAPKDLKISVPRTVSLRGGASKTIKISVDARAVPLGETRFATITFRSGSITRVFPVTIVRRQGPVAVTKVCDPDPVVKNRITTCTVTLTNNGAEDATVALADKLPSRLGLVRGSVVGGTEVRGQVRFQGTIPGRQDPTIGIAAGSSPAGYLPLSSFGIAPIGGIGDESIANYNVPAFTLAGETYTRIGIVSNGYAVLGGGTAADVDYVNQILPDAALPNNVLAPWWTDLNPSEGGQLRIGTLTDGTNTWLVLDWQAVKEYSTAATNSFQIWIGLAANPGGGEDVSFTYGTLQGNGDGGFLTVGAENPSGTSGGMYYGDGVGTLPTSATELRVTGEPGVTLAHTVTYQAKARSTGTYVNDVVVTGDTFDGVAIARFTGRVVRR